MRPASFVTTVGSTSGRRDGSDVVIAHEPDVGATLRTRGRFYALCEVEPPSRAGAEIAAEVSELVRYEYYYDLSAGVEVALRRALRKANRRAAQLLQGQRGRVRLHLACAVVVNNEVHAARVGGAQVFLVRHARLFLPGEEPDELADLLHHTGARQASSLGAEADLLPNVWRQTIAAADTLILTSGSVIATLGAEALKNAAVMLHPVAAALQVRERFAAEGASGSDATIFIEVAPAPAAATRRAGTPEVPATPAEVAIAETIRSRLDSAQRVLPRPGRALGAIVRPLSLVAARAVGVVLELMPRTRPRLPRRHESARRRSARVQRATSLLALLLLLATVGIGAVVVRDYQTNQVINDYRAAIVSVENDIASARSFGARNDADRAWQRLDTARDALARAGASPAADQTRVAELREEIRAIGDRLDGVIVDLARDRTGAAPADLSQTVNGLYAADPGAGRLWRLFDEPVRAGAVLTRGEGGVGTPLVVAAAGEALLTLDDARRLWRAEGNSVEEIELPETDRWKGATDLATFAGNVYVLDSESGQLWRYEPQVGGGLSGPLAFLPEPLPAGAPRMVAVDGDIWVLTSAGEVQRYRRQGGAPVLTRLPFTLQWLGTPLRPTHIQKLEEQRSLWLLDAPARTVVQLTPDGREIARFALPERLDPPAAFFVSEGQRIAYTVHGSKVAATDVSR